MTAPPKAATNNGWTLFRRLTATFIVLGIFVVAGAIIAGVSLARLNSAQHRQVDRLDPAIQTTTDLFISLVDQETGLRGYGLTRKAAFLQPYTDGRNATNKDLARLRNQLAGEKGLLVDVNRLATTARGWQQAYAEPGLIQIQHTAAGVIPNLPYNEGKRRFDQIRADYNTLNTSFSSARKAARGQLRTSTQWLIALVIAAVVLATLAAIALWRALRRWIVSPLGALRREVRLVAGGDLEHAVAVAGPPDIVELGDDAELMRRRMLADYHDALATQKQVVETAEELRRSNSELEQFAYIASHDLQEPLRKVASFCQMLERRYAGQLDARADQYIYYAVDGAKRMQNLINDLLAFSRVGRTTTAFKPVDLSVTVANALSDLETRLSEVNGTVEVGELPTLPGDPSLLRQLFMNLIGNALKFRSELPPHVQITAERAGPLWRFTVKDNGIGIDPRYAEKIFAIFSRLHAREDYEGTGIGLALCRKIVEFHGGTIRVVLDQPAADSAPPGAQRSTSTGATLCFTLPVAAVPTAPANPILAAPALSTPGDS
jgi:signal transduction histidine kinase